MTGKTHEDMRKTEVRVVAFYPEFVLCQGASYRTCYRYYELWARTQPKERKEVKIPDYIKG